MKKLLMCLFIVSLSSCSWFNTTKNEVEILPPPKVTHVAQQKPKKIKRDLGSLWSEDSHWNQMYSPTQTRAAGDIVTIKLDKKFMARMEQAIRRPALEEPKAEEKNSKKVSSKEKIQEKGEGDALSEEATSSQASRGPASQGSSPYKLPETVEVTIVEALPRGFYRVAANHGFKPAPDSPYVYIQGVLREREISADDSASSDALLDLKFESINRDRKITSFEEEDNS